MIVPALALCVAAQRVLHVLFLGNSHTYVNNVPELVRSLAAADHRQIAVSMVTGPHIDDLAKRPDVVRNVQSGHWDVVVIQAAMVSSSHRYDYPQDLAIQIASQAKGAGARVLLFSEWPRRGWDETVY